MKAHRIGRAAIDSHFIDAEIQQFARRIVKVVSDGDRLGIVEAVHHHDLQVEHPETARGVGHERGAEIHHAPLVLAEYIAVGERLRCV